MTLTDQIHETRKKMHKRIRGTAALAIIAVGVGLGAGEVAAQNLGVSLAGETAGDDVHLIFGQLTAVADGTGWLPVASVSAYNVFLPGDDSWGLTPAVGLRYRVSGGFVQGKVGWAFRPDDDDPLIGAEGEQFFGGGNDGLHTALHGEFWGDGSWVAQGLASVNWGSDYLWSRGRLGRRVADLSGGGGVALGGELVWQGELDDPTVGEKFSAIQVGPFIQWVTSPDGPVASLSGGWKSTDPADEDTWYAKVEVSF